MVYEEWRVTVTQVCVEKWWTGPEAMAHLIELLASWPENYATWPKNYILLELKPFPQLLDYAKKHLAGGD